MHLVLWGGGGNFDISGYFVISGFDITGVDCMYYAGNYASVNLYNPELSQSDIISVHK